MAVSAFLEVTGKSVISGLVMILGLGGVLYYAAPAQAESSIGELRYQDSFGNLIIHNPGSYKIILVGQTYQEAGLRDEVGPKIIYGSDYGLQDEGQYEDAPCSRLPVLLHGRSYMYGLPDNVVPVPAGICH